MWSEWGPCSTTCGPGIQRRNFVNLNRHDIYSCHGYEKRNCNEKPCPGSAVASGWAGWALAHPEFGSSVNPITTRGADYAHHITASPPGFEMPAASLYTVWPSLHIPNPSNNIQFKNFEINFIHHLQILDSLLVYHTSLLKLKIPTNPTQRHCQLNSRNNLISLKDFIHHLKILDLVLVYHTSLLNLKIQTNPTQRHCPLNSRNNLISLKDFIHHLKI